MGLLVCVAASAIAVGTTACEAPGPAPIGGTVSIAELSAPRTLFPVVEEGELDAQLDGLLYLGLTQLEWSNGRLQSVAGPLALATRWEFGPDSSTILFHLRPDTRWSDGMPLTAQDVVFSYELYADSVAGSPRIRYVEEIAGVEALDDRTVAMTFRRPYPQMLFHASLGIVPRHIYADADRARLRAHPRVVEPGGGNLVVSGPFQVGSWKDRQELVLVPNPQSWVQPRVARVVLRVLPEESTRRIELERGAVDVARLTSLSEARRLEENREIRIERQPMRFYDYIGWSPSARRYFADPEARRALSLAIHRSEILEALDLTAYATPAGGPYPPIFADFQDPRVEPDPYRPDEAASILERLGATDRDGDGIREWDGEPMRFTLLTNAGNARRIAAAAILQAQLRRIGVAVEIRQIETAAFFQRLRERDFEAALAGWSVALTPELNVFRSDAAHLNFVAYSNPVFDSLFHLARAQPSAEAAAPYWREAAGVVARDRPYAFLWFYDMIWGVRARVRGVRIDPLGAYQNLHEWYVVNP